MKKLLFLLAIVPVLALGQNYVKTTIYKQKGNGNPTYSINYFDGLGRPIQHIAHKQASNNNDIVTQIEYDAFGRQVKDYLPIVSGQTLDYHEIIDTDIINYYTSSTNLASESSSYPFSEKELENSPLNRIYKQSAPGQSWHMGSGHEVKFDYQTNQTADGVKLFKVTTSWDTICGCYKPVFVNQGEYEEHQLYKNITKNENWVSGNNNTTEEFKDKEGRVVLKRTYADITKYDVLMESEAKHDTYYVYDDYGNLTYVLPPLVDIDNVTTDVLGNLCYQYKYDHRNRLVEKKLPGKQWEFIVYNNQDMPVATGPAKNPWGEDVWGWMVTKYDIFGRVVYTGWSDVLRAVTSKDRTDFLSNLGSIWDEKSEGTTIIDHVSVSYTNTVFPQQIKLLTVNYYDRYNHTFEPETIPSQIEGQDVLSNVKTLPTTNWVRVLTTPNDTNAEITHSFYDIKARVIATEKTNYLGGYTKSNSVLDFLGKTLYSVTYHKRTNSSSELTVKDYYVYTEQERLLCHKQKVNDEEVELIVKNDYDELGQLISKQVGGQDIANLVGYQKVDYRYNIRGWLKSINDVAKLDIANEPIDLFAFKINYDKVENQVNYVGKELYNGNISETYWRTNTDNILRKYGYHYDDLNRLRNSIYQKNDLVTNMYNEWMNYDKNGNIINLGRNGDLDLDDASTGVLQIDDLEYYYHPEKKNQLMKVDDGIGISLGFKNGTNTDDDYGYDDNGNMTSDLNKDITLIKYNHLNLPIEINFGSGFKIQYLYNAIGQKVRKMVIIGSSSIATDYLDGYQYTNQLLKLFPHPEGYVTALGDPESQSFFYVYNYTDHLGNIRLSYGKDPETNVLKIMEENHYYPFGLKHTNYNMDKMVFTLEQLEEQQQQQASYHIDQLLAGQDAPYKYKYNGKEWQDELGLSIYAMDMRQYDPAIGRWIVQDPVVHFGTSPYNAFDNNPVLYKDPSGSDSETDIYGRSRFDSFSGIYIPPSDRKGSNESSPNINLNDVKASFALQQTSKLYFDNEDVSNLSEGQKQVIFKEDALKTIGILLYEFATGTGKEDRDFFYNVHPFANKYVDARINEIIYYSNEKIKELGFKNPSQYTDVFQIGLPFSPSLNPSSWGNSLAHIISSDAVGQFIGGSIAKIQINNGIMQCTIDNATSRNSLFLHLGENYNRKDGKTILSTIYQHIHFTAEVIIK